MALCKFHGCLGTTNRQDDNPRKGSKYCDFHLDHGYGEYEFSWSLYMRKKYGSFENYWS